MKRLVLIVLAFLLAPSSAARAELLWGANGHPITAYPGISIGRQLDYLSDLGMTSYRVNISFADEADQLAELVEEGRARGIDILPVITPGNIDLEGQSAEEIEAATRTLAVALSSRFKDDIRVWELGNEMENYAIIQPCETRDDGTQYPCDWGAAAGRSTLEYYGPRWEKVSAALKGMSEGVASVDPGLRRAMGTAGWGHVGAFDRMRADGIEWDISVWHMYEEDQEWALEALAEFGKPIWITEFNHPFGSQKGEDEQAAGLTSMMARIKSWERSYGVEAAHLYELLDETYWAPDYEAYMGLVRLVPAEGETWRLGEPKPAYRAVRDMIRGVSEHAPPERSCDPARTARTGDIVRRRIGDAFCLVIGRSPTEQEIETRSGTLADTDRDAVDMLVGLVASEEFEARYRPYSLSNESYVKLLFQLLLGREVDGYGLESYSGQLRAGEVTRLDIAEGILRSSEFAARYPVFFAG